MAARRISSLVTHRRSFSPSIALLSSGRLCHRISQYSTSTIEEPVKAPVEVSCSKLLIDGQFVDAVSGKTFPTMDPRTGEVIAHVAEGDKEDVDIAVAAARKAFSRGPWPKMIAYERSNILLRFADLLEKHNDEIAALESWDTGKPFKQSALVEVPMLTRFFRYYAGWADKIQGLTVPVDGSYHCQTLHEPIGVCGQIIPWNFPLLMYGWKVAPALACGNTVVMKTAEQTPLSALYVSNLLLEAGLPPGVVNIVSGHGNGAGAALCLHMDVDKLAFTGSTETGKKVLAASANSNLKAVTLELGGKSPFIVCEDANVDEAVDLAHEALFFNMGQCCCAGSRTYVHERVYDEFVEKAKARATNRVVGDPFRDGTEQGPQIYPHWTLDIVYLNINPVPTVVNLAGKPGRKPGAKPEQSKNSLETETMWMAGGRMLMIRDHVALIFLGESVVEISQEKIDSAQFEKILYYIRSGIDCGAKLEVGGDKIGEKGFYIKPTVFSNVQDDMMIAQDEIFGPVQSILKFKTLDEVIERANATQYGLAAGVFTRSLDTANTMMRALRAGTVWINCYDTFDAAIPFGGYKMSGLGREKGMYGLNNYLQIKAVVMPVKNPAWL